MKSFEFTDADHVRRKSAGLAFDVQATKNFLVRRAENIGFDRGLFGFEGAGQGAGEFSFHRRVEHHLRFLLGALHKHCRARVRRAGLRTKPCAHKHEQRKQRNIFHDRLPPSTRSMRAGSASAIARQSRYRLTPRCCESVRFHGASSKATGIFIVVAKYCAIGSESSTAQQKRWAANSTRLIAMVFSVAKRAYLSTMMNDRYEILCFESHSSDASWLSGGLPVTMPLS